MYCIPTTEQDVNTKGFSWRKTVDAISVQKRRLLAKRRLSANFEKAGFTNPSTTRKPKRDWGETRK
jgi:hypothetical protein